MICSFACFDLLGLILYVLVNNLSVLSGWAYLGGSSTKQRVKCLFALILFSSQSDRDDFLSYCFIPVSVSCTRTQHSDSDVCKSRTSKPSIEPLRPRRHERLRQTLYIITLILLDSLLLINKKRHADNIYLHVWILKRNVPFRRFF